MASIGDLKGKREGEVKIIWYEGANKIKTAWVESSSVVKLRPEEAAKKFKRKQLSLSRGLKQDLLQDIG